MKLAISIRRWPPISKKRDPEKGRPEKTGKAAMWELSYCTSARTAIPSAQGGF